VTSGRDDTPVDGAMREVTILVRHHGEPESDVSANHPGVTLRSISSMTGRAAERKRIVELSGDHEQIASFLAEFRATEPVQAAEPLSPLGRSRIYAAIVYDAHNWDSIAERLTEMGLHYRTGTTITAGWERWTLYLEGSDDLAAIVGSLEDAGNETQLVKSVELGQIEPARQLNVTRLVDELTPRQQEILRAAIDSGYYDPGRDVTIEEIGEQFDLATTTTWEHLQRAEAKVMADIGDYLQT
jgi:hypothetical protein